MTEATETENRTQAPSSNTGMGAAEPQSKGSLNVQEIEDIIYQRGPGTLTVEQLKHYQRETSKEDDPYAGSLKQNTKSSVARRNDLEKAQLKEEDVIDALYHAMIDLGLEGEKLLRREIIYRFDRIKAGRADKKANGPDDDNFVFKMKDAYEGAHLTYDIEDIDSKKKADRIAKAISKGTLLDDKNKDIYNDFKEMVKDDPKGQEILAKAEERCATYKRHPDGADAQANKKACESAANEFIIYSYVTINRDSKVKHTAIDYTYGECCHRSDLNQSQMEAHARTTNREYTDKLRAATEAERIATIERMTQEAGDNREMIHTMIASNSMSMPVTDNFRMLSHQAMKQGLDHGKETDFNPYLDTSRELLGMKPRVIEQPVITGTLEDAAKQLPQHNHAADFEERMEELNNREHSPRRERTRNRLHRLRKSQDGRTNENENENGNSPRKNRFLDKRLSERE